MENIKFLYGAAVQGIQRYIFQTNELKDIIGASELVEQICTTAFDEFKEEGDESNMIINAAGNIKYMFTRRESCEKAVLSFPRKVMEMAPGITVSQAVVCINGQSFEEAVDELEKRLRIQRNRPTRPVVQGLIGMERSRKTGLPAQMREGNDYIDGATILKRKAAANLKFSLCEKCFGSFDKKNITNDLNKFTGQNDWIAIIHADGNGLGKVVQKIGKDKRLLRQFSQELEKATCEAAQEAYLKVSSDNPAFNNVIPIRPIVLGGDDFTVICQASFAIDYLFQYLKAFEIKTHEHLGAILSTVPECGNHLTACGGVAFIKSSYPFYYGYNLAESLCSEAKKDCKRLSAEAPSCLMFHKVQDSFVEDYKAITLRELTPATGYSWSFGPYYLTPQSKRWSIEELLNNVKQLDSKEGNAVKSHLRQWLSLMHDDPQIATQKVMRVLAMLPLNSTLSDMVKKITQEIKRDGEETMLYPVYDILSICSIIYQDTKSQRKKEDKI